MRQTLVCLFLLAGLAGVWTVPDRAVVAQDKKEDKDEKGSPRLLAQQVFVTTGPTRGDQVAILKGIEPGTEVVTSGQVKLKTGTPLIIDNKVQPANSPNPTPQEK